MIDGQLQTSIKTQNIAYIRNDKEKPGKCETKQQSTVQFKLHVRVRMRKILHNYKDCDFTSDDN
jgi:hypothetical protein